MSYSVEFSGTIHQIPRGRFFGSYREIGRYDNGNMDVTPFGIPNMVVKLTQDELLGIDKIQDGSYKDCLREELRVSKNISK